jgi:hypothetical protein
LPPHSSGWHWDNVWGTPRFLPQDFWQRVYPRFRHLAILLRRHTADANGPNNFLVDDNGQAPLDGESARQLEDRGPVMRHQGLRKRLAGARAGDGRQSLLDGDLDTSKLRLVQTLEREQMPAVVHHDHDDMPRVRDGFFLSRGRQ